MTKIVSSIIVASMLVITGCSQEEKKPVEMAQQSVEEEEIDGYVVYKRLCQACHVELMTAKEAMANLATLKAPPMIEVSHQIKKMITYNGGDEDTERELRLTFIRDYIINPSIDKAMCNLGAIDKFDVMPSQKGLLTEAELFAVSEWVYDRYEGMEFK